jgi:hypothetical protein
MTMMNDDDDDDDGDDDNISLIQLTLEIYLLQVHVSKSSRVADHCRSHALSDHSDRDFISKCDHEHDLRCDRCDLIQLVFSELDSALKELASHHEEKKEYVVAQSKQNTQA